MEQSALRAELLADADGVAQLLRFLEHGGFDGLLHWNLRDPDDAWVSPGFARILGFELGDIDHMASWWRRRVVREDLGPTIAAAERTAADPSVPFDRVVRYHHRDGRTVAVRARGIALRDDEGRPHRFLGLHTDVTEMVETEQALTRANEVLQQFAGTIAHDLRNPLAAATGMLRLVRGAGAAALSDEQRDDLLDQTLGALERPVDVRGPLPAVWGNPTALRHVLVNLVDNACKYARPGTSPRVVVAHGPSVRGTWPRGPASGSPRSGCCSPSSAARSPPTPGRTAPARPCACGCSRSPRHPRPDGPGQASSRRWRSRVSSLGSAPSCSASSRRHAS